MDTQVKSTLNVSPAEILEKAIGMQAMLREKAQHTRSLRRIPDETMAELIDAGFFKMTATK